MDIWSRLCSFSCPPANKSNLLPSETGITQPCLGEGSKDKACATNFKGIADRRKMNPFKWEISTNLCTAKWAKIAPCCVLISSLLRFLRIRLYWEPDNTDAFCAACWQDVSSRRTLCTNWLVTSLQTSNRPTHWPVKWDKNTKYIRYKLQHLIDDFDRQTLIDDCATHHSSSDIG